MPRRPCAQYLVGLSFVLSACSSATADRVQRSPPLTGRIVFSRELQGTVYGLYSMAPDGSDIRPLSTTSGVSLQVPVVSPNGLSVAVVGYPTPTAAAALYLVDADGTGLHKLDVPFSAGISWSPDSRHLVFGCYSTAAPAGESPASLCTVDTDGSHLQQIVHSPIGRWSPTWSPDGLQVAYVSDSIVDPVVGGTEKLFVMDLASGQVHLVTDNAFFNTDPVWSADGSWIAFLSARTGSPNEAFVIHPDGTGEGQLSFSPGAGVCAAVAPSGQTALLCRDGQIYSVGLDGSGAHPITSDSHPSIWPSWGPSPR